MLTPSLLILALAFQSPAPEPNEQNFAQWRDYIKPKAAELTFESCNWKPTYWEAVTEAQQKQKPILLWAMNGHPMACT